MSLKGPVRTAQ